MTLVGRALDDPALARLLLDVAVGRTLVDVVADVRARESTGMAEARAMVAGLMGPAGTVRR